MGSVGSTKSIGITETRRILGDSANMRADDTFIKALANAQLEYNEDGEIRFKFAGTDKSTGKTVIKDITAYDKKQAQQDIRANGFTIKRLYTNQVYNAIINHSDGESWDYKDATKVDNALLKNRKR